MLVVCPKILRSCWPLGRVLDVNVGKGGSVRPEQDKTMNTELVRLVENLRLLEAHEDK